MAIAVHPRPKAQSLIRYVRIASRAVLQHGREPRVTHSADSARVEASRCPDGRVLCVARATYCQRLRLVTLDWPGRCGRPTAGDWGHRAPKNTYATCIDA